MSSIDIDAIDVGASSDSSSLDNSDSEVEVEVTQIVQQQKQQQQQQEEEEEGEEDLGRELDESAKSSRTCPLPNQPAAGSLKGSWPRPAVQNTIVNFFYDATVARSTSKTTTTGKRREKRQQEVEEPASHPRAPAQAANIDRTRVTRLHKDRRKDGERDKEEEEEEEEEEVVVAGKRSRRQLKASKNTTAKRRVSARQRIEQFPNESLEEVDGKIICRACQKGVTVDKKSTITTHCNGDVHRQALVIFERKKRSKQVFQNVVQSTERAGAKSDLKF